MGSTSLTPFAGPIFEVLAGPGLKSLLAHPNILSKSDKLKALVEGGWKDSLERKVVLEDWDEETVARLLEWLYTDDYSSPFPQTTASTTAQTPADIPVVEVADNVRSEDLLPPRAKMQAIAAFNEASEGGLGQKMPLRA